MNDDLGITDKPFSREAFRVPADWLAAQSALVKESVRNNNFAILKDGSVGVLDEKRQFQTWPNAPRWVRPDAEGQIKLEH